MDGLDKLKALNNEARAQNERDIKHAALIDSNTQTQQVIVRVIEQLVDFLDNRISKTEVVNQLEKIGTPDVYAVVQAVESLNQTVENRPTTDLAEVTRVLKDVLAETQKIPKSVDTIDIPKPIDHTRQLESLQKAVEAVEASIKAQDLHVEAPVVNVPEPEVHIEAPDLKPITEEQKKTREDLKKAIRAIVIPETDLTKLEKESKEHTKLLKAIRDKPVPSFSAGGGRATPYQSSDDTPQFVELESDGSIPVTVKNSSSSSSGKPTDAYALSNIDDTTSTEYYGYEDKDGKWYIKKLASNAFTFSAGSSNYSAAWIDRASQTYASYGSTF